MMLSPIQKESPHGTDRAGSFFVGLRTGRRDRDVLHRRFDRLTPYQLAAPSEAAFSVSSLLRSTSLVPVKSVISA